MSRRCLKLYGLVPKILNGQCFPLWLVFILIGCSLSSGPKLLPGDIVFQEMDSPQGEAIKLATGSDYTHCGILFEDPKGGSVVVEAVQPVRITPLEKWIARGVGQNYLVMRLDGSDSLLTKEVLDRMFDAGKKLVGRDYDLLFAWSDDRMYCSELVWKLYSREAGITLAVLRTLRDFDLSHPLVRKKLSERYGDDIPLAEPVIAPADLLASNILKTVYQGTEKP